MTPFDSIDGWINLGAYSEAAEELNNLPPEFKSSVPFLRAWIRIYAAQKAWSNVELLTQTLLAHEPADHFGLFHRAEALHQQGRTRDAILLIQHTEYGRNTGEGLYNRARYMASIEKFDAGYLILKQAFALDIDLAGKAMHQPEFTIMLDALKKRGR